MKCLLKYDLQFILIETCKTKKDKSQHGKSLKAAYSLQLSSAAVYGENEGKVGTELFFQSRVFDYHGSSLLSWGREEWNANSSSLPHVVRGAAPGFVHLPPRWIQWKQGEGGVECHQRQNSKRGFTDVHEWRWRGLLALDGGIENMKTYRPLCLYQGICKIVTYRRQLPIVSLQILPS